MIDIKHFREYPEKYEESAKQRGLEVDFAKLKTLDAKRLSLIEEVDELRAKLNVKGKPDAKQLAELKKAKTELEKAEAEQEKVSSQLEELLAQVPNLLAPGTPAGGEEANKVIRKWGTAKRGGKDHLSFMEKRGWIDFERGAKVAGSKFYFLRGEAVKLERSITDLAMAKVAQAGFTFLAVPHLVTERISRGTGFTPRGPEKQVYSVEGEDLHLIATAEVPLTGYHADEIIPESELPLCYAALSPSYRREAGAYGKHSKGLYRVHQFNKVEMYVYCAAEDSGKWLAKLVEAEEGIAKALGIPYRVTLTAAGDMGLPHYQKYDLEYWSPADGEYRELTSASNCTDFQARRLNIRNRESGIRNRGTVFVHTLNATAVATSRALIGVVENHQQDGKLVLPDQLADYYGAKSL